jgi:hypothetical protein
MTNPREIEVEHTPLKRSKIGFGFFTALIQSAILVTRVAGTFMAKNRRELQAYAFIDCR